MEVDRSFVLGWERAKSPLFPRVSGHTFRWDGLSATVAELAPLKKDRGGVGKGGRFGERSDQS